MIRLIRPRFVCVFYSDKLLFFVVFVVLIMKSGMCPVAGCISVVVDPLLFDRLNQKILAACVVLGCALRYSRR